VSPAAAPAARRRAPRRTAVARCARAVRPLARDVPAPPVTSQLVHAAVQPVHELAGDVVVRINVEDFACTAKSLNTADVSRQNQRTQMPDRFGGLEQLKVMKVVLLRDLHSMG
jgi:hypothetical protein